jgi:large subunit ribosomal protein L29
MREVESLRPLDDQQLAAQLDDSIKRLFMLRFTQTTEKVKSTADFQKLRRSIARIRTLQRERELGLTKKNPKPAAGK